MIFICSRNLGKMEKRRYLFFSKFELTEEIMLWVPGGLGRDKCVFEV